MLSKLYKKNPTNAPDTMFVVSFRVSFNLPCVKRKFCTNHTNDIFV